MARRGRGEGSISQRKEGRWEARIVDHNGRRRCLYAKTRQGVARELRRAQSAADKGLAIPSLTRTVEEHLTGWLDSTTQEFEIEVTASGQVEIGINPGHGHQYRSVQLERRADSKVSSGPGRPVPGAG